MINRSIALKEQEIKKAEGERNWSSILGSHERPYRFKTFQKYARRMTDAEYWEEVSWLWIDSENIFEYLDEWEKVWKSPRPGRETVMDDEERAFLAAQPKSFTVYRGTFIDLVGVRGMSWTLDRDKAIWFSRRYKPKAATAYVATGQVRRRNVFAYFSGRNESEIVISPDRVHRVTVDRIED